MLEGLSVASIVEVNHRWSKRALSRLSSLQNLVEESSLFLGLSVSYLVLIFHGLYVGISSEA
jgi:hypothetical protein